MSTQHPTNLADCARDNGVTVSVAAQILRDLGFGSYQPTSFLSKERSTELSNRLRELRLGKWKKNHMGRDDRADRAVGRQHTPGTLRRKHSSALLAAIPRIYYALTQDSSIPKHGMVVVYHDRLRKPRYGIENLHGDVRNPEPPLTTRHEALKILREVNKQYSSPGLFPPNTFIAFDPNRHRAWVGESRRSLQRKLKGQPFDAQTGKQLEQEKETPSPPQLGDRAQPFTPQQAIDMLHSIGADRDHPDEVFLLDEGLLRLAVDSLTEANLLDPPPVHTNALWVFSRPIVMFRDNGQHRHVRAIWYREGKITWRIQSFTGGIGHKGLSVKQVGKQLFDTLPFVPRWDENYPEQRMIAAVWALMTQGDISSTERSTASRTALSVSPASTDERDLVIVRLQAGSPHAQVYDRPADNSFARPTWTVRGHWRRQPYPSLGRDEFGNVYTRLIWIAQYTKGTSTDDPPGNKVIIVSKHGSRMQKIS